MTRITFENSYGRLDFAGGGDAILRLTEITGLGMPTQELSVVSYPGERGQKTVTARDLPRIVTMAGDAQTVSIRRELARMNRILYRPGELRIQAGAKRRKIQCRCTSFEDAERLGFGFARYVLQFTCDDPAFSDFTDTTTAIFQRVNKLTAPFTLPMVMTERITEADVDVIGDMDTEPVVTIYASQASGESAEIRVVNETTGKAVALTYAMTEGETVTIDTSTPSITSDTASGSLIQTITQDTRLTDFKLVPGINHLRLASYAPGDTLAVSCIYANRYLEAIY